MTTFNTRLAALAILALFPSCTILSQSDLDCYFSPDSCEEEEGGGETGEQEAPLGPWLCTHWQSSGNDRQHYSACVPMSSPRASDIGAAWAQLGSSDLGEGLGFIGFSEPYIMDDCDPVWSWLQDYSEAGLPFVERAYVCDPVAGDSRVLEVPGGHIVLSLPQGFEEYGLSKAWSVVTRPDDDDGYGINCPVFETVTCRGLLGDGCECPCASDADCESYQRGPWPPSVCVEASACTPSP